MYPMLEFEGHIDRAGYGAQPFAPTANVPQTVCFRETHRRVAAGSQQYRPRPGVVQDVDVVQDHRRIAGTWVESNVTDQRRRHVVEVAVDQTQQSQSSSDCDDTFDRFDRGYGA